jgi:hypothetical protein
MEEGGAKHKTKGALEAAGEKLREVADGSRQRQPASRRRSREED